MNAALEALLTLAGQNMYDHDVLVELLIAKGLITQDEWDKAVEKKYLSSISPAEWAQRSINPEDGEALDTFFSKQ